MPEPTPEDHMAKLRWLADESASCGLVSAASRAAAAWALGRIAALEAERAALRDVADLVEGMLEGIDYAHEHGWPAAVGDRSRRVRLMREAVAAVRKAAGPGEESNDAG